MNEGSRLRVLNSCARKANIKNPKWLALFAFVVTSTILTMAAGAQQQEAKVFRVGYLSEQGAGPGRRGGARESIRRHLQALGYVEGKTIIFDYRYADNKPERLPSLADGLVRLKVDLILAGSSSAALAAKASTRTIPIVFLGAADPVALGLVDSLARPGGNVTGIINIAETLAGKRLEILKETIPKLNRVAVLWNPRGRESVQQWQESQIAARELGLQLHSMEVNRADRFEGAFKEAVQAGSDALVGTQEPLFAINQKRIVQLAARHRLPAIYSRADYVDKGGLMSYGPDRTEPYTRAALIIDKILKGANPADVPVEQSANFGLVLNLKTASTLHVTIPPIMLVQAQRLIK